MIRIYLIKIENGTSHPKFSKFFYNVTVNLRGDSLDFGGPPSHFVVKSGGDAEYVLREATEKLRRYTKDVSIEEITEASLRTKYKYSV